jgi:hypothetical protein
MPVANPHVLQQLLRCALIPAAAQRCSSLHEEEGRRLRSGWRGTLIGNGLVPFFDHGTSGVRGTD